MSAIPLRSRVYAGLLVGVTAAGLALAYARGDREWSARDVIVAFLLLGMILLAEFFDIAFSGALAFAVSVGAAVSFGTGLELGAFPAAIIVMGAHLVDGVYARRQAMKTIVNVANLGFSTLVSASVYSVLQDANESTIGSVRNMVAVTVAALVFMAVNTGALSLIVAPVVGANPLTMWRANFSGLSVELLTLPAIGSLVPVLAAEAPPALLVLVVPLIGPHLAFKAMRRAQDETRVTMEGLADVLERRDPYTHEHSMRVTNYVSAILAEMPHVPYDIGRATLAAARIHDLGKVGTADMSLRKPGPLTEAERREIQQHAAIGAEILNRLEQYRESAAIVRHHHERWDGLGYPDALAGEAIPLGARIIAVADTFDAMTTDRAYRPAMGVTFALEEIGRQSGRQFDPGVVAAFERAVAGEGAAVGRRVAVLAMDGGR